MNWIVLFLTQGSLEPGMNMNKILKAVITGLIVTAVTSCVSPVETSDQAGGFKFVQLCDTQLGFGGYEQDVRAFEQAVRQINDLKPDFVVLCGDLVDDANEQSFADFNRIKSGFQVPCYCAPGNHDIGSPPVPESLKLYRETIGKDYYSFEHKNRLFAVVNSQLWKTPVKKESKKQDAWLKKTLKEAEKKKLPVFIICHHPFFLKEPGEADQYFNLPLEKRTELLTLFRQRGVAAVLGGHAHKLLVNEYQGIQLVNGETTSRNFDKRLRGFRLWHIGDTRPFNVDFIPLDGF
jgi:3',5'-cyclic AMP phosphodiesterase CpdA